MKSQQSVYDENRAPNRRAKVSRAVSLQRICCQHRVQGKRKRKIDGEVGWSLGEFATDLPAPIFKIAGLDVTEHSCFVFFSGIIATKKASESFGTQVFRQRMPFAESLCLKPITGPRREMCGVDAKIDALSVLAFAAT